MNNSLKQCHSSYTGAKLSIICLKFIEISHKNNLSVGLEIKNHFHGAKLHLHCSFIKVLCISNSTSLGFLQKHEGAAAAGEFKGALGSWL